MAIYIDKLPQVTTPIKAISLRELVDILPDVLQYPINVWIGERMARYGISTGNLIFLTDEPGETTAAMRLYFSSLVRPLGVYATVRSDWRNDKWQHVRLYDKGVKIKKDYPSATEIAVITADDIRKLPMNIPWTFDVYLTGSVAKYGWSANDADFIVDPQDDKQVYIDMRNYFTELLGWKCHVGEKVMVERDLPNDQVCLIPIYKNGIWLH